MAAHLAAWELPDGETRLKQYVKGKPIATAGPIRSLEISLSFSLKAGKTYSIIPAPKDAGAKGEFFLSFYFSCELNDIMIER